ncbi:MAG: hypothetical protein MI919_26380, partial [Holophagales bacterium]|nr:hypothetical protein [Holophagales bacterium]
MAGAASVAAEPRRGDLITFSGRVVDSEGVPLSGLAVVLEASRTHFSLRKLGKREGPALRQPARVEADGSFRGEW